MSPVPGHIQEPQKQTPSRVLLLKNLPKNCTEKELLDFARQFGMIRYVERNAGGKRDQAYIKFEDRRSAINMFSYCASSPEEVLIRWSNFLLEYAEHDLVNKKDDAGNVLLVTIHGRPDHLEAVTVDHLRLMFSPYGYVNEIALYKKDPCEAFVHFTDSESAYAAKFALNESLIPMYLLPKVHRPMCVLRIKYPTMADGNKKSKQRKLCGTSAKAK